MRSETKNPIQKAAEDWEAKAIEECRNDPAVAAAGLCPVCMCHHPCLCVQYERMAAMRTYYEANRRTLTRSEPKLTGSWGKPIDALMRNLYRIAHGEDVQ